MPIISVVLTVGNVENTLEKCLKSILNQKFYNFELLCINCGCSDSSMNILKQYSDSRIKILDYVCDEIVQGKNVGLRFATGQYIFFMLGNDFIHKNTLYLLYKLSKEYNASLVILNKNIESWLHHIGNFFRTLLKLYNLSGVDYIVTESVLKYSGSRFEHWGRDVLKKLSFPVVGFFSKDFINGMFFGRGNIVADISWWGELMLRHPLSIIIKTPLYFYVRTDSEIDNSYNVVRIIDVFADSIISMHLLYKQNATSDEFRCYQREYLLPFVRFCFDKLSDVSNGIDKDLVYDIGVRMNNVGVFDNPPTSRDVRFAYKVKNTLYKYKKN